MRTTTLKSILAGAVYLVGSILTIQMGSVLQAQSYNVKAHIPFPFEVSSKVMPEGDYIFTQSPSRPVAEIVNWRTGRRCYVVTGFGTAGGPARHTIQFHRYGNAYFLSQIWTGGESGSALLTSKHEKELMRSTKTAAVEVISIAIRAD